MEHVFDGSSDSAENLEDDIGLVTGEALGSTLDGQLLLGIVIEALGGRVDLDILDDVQDDRQSRVDLGLINDLAGRSGDDPDDQSRDQSQNELLIGEDEIHRFSLSCLLLR